MMAGSRMLSPMVRRLVPQRTLPPCGGGTGRGVATDAELTATPLPNPPPVEVGFTRFRPVNTWANPGRPGFAWGREHTAVAACLLNTPRSAHP